MLLWVQALVWERPPGREASPDNRAEGRRLCPVGYSYGGIQWGRSGLPAAMRALINAPQAGFAGAIWYGTVPGLLESTVMNRPQTPPAAFHA